MNYFQVLLLQTIPDGNPAWVIVFVTLVAALGGRELLAMAANFFFKSKDARKELEREFAIKKYEEELVSLKKQIEDERHITITCNERMDKMRDEFDTMKKNEIKMQTAITLFVAFLEENANPDNSFILNQLKQMEE
jgi:hypothetical protein